MCYFNGSKPLSAIEAQNMDWNAIIEGLKPYESILKVVVHDVLKDAIDLPKPSNHL